MQKKLVEESFYSLQFFYRKFLTIFIFFDKIKVNRKKRSEKMFKAKRKSDQKIVQVLDTYVDNYFGITYFFIWENDGWRWRLASNFVPPNYDFSLDKGGLE